MQLLTRLAAGFLPFLPASFLAAQDLVGVGWTGGIWTIDSTTGAATMTGNGLFGQNALAFDDQHRLWCTTRTPNTPYVYGLTVVDPVANTATQMFTNSSDFRGLAGTGTSMLYGIRDGAPDTLCLIDTTTGNTTVVGGTGRSSIQALALHRGVLYAWDLSAGLLTINPANGAATDVNAAVGGSVGSGSIQFMCSHSDGRLLAGGTSLYSIDVNTGTATLIGLISASADLRGAEQYFGSITSFGQGCNGPSGPIVLTVTGTPSPNQLLTATSVTHAGGIFGFLVFGFSNTTYNSQPLPINVDPLLGTTGCALLVSPDATLLGSATPGGSLGFGLFLPQVAANLTFHLQHAAFDPVPGGMSFSNGVTVHVGP
jgi:hypothetical protein